MYVPQEFHLYATQDIDATHVLFLAGAVALTTGFINSDTGIIWLDQVSCVGTELRLLDCPANAIGLHDCVNSEDAGVRCLDLPGTLASTDLEHCINHYIVTSHNVSFVLT